ncbi:hypothetical protein [Sporosalibacterium faouarense]|uniref:hypothetical protein n=1 Tax=Sporosalibacterium faouarense TaxID=516123 RepID=UPI00192C4C8D|nr:hypothetical protein [Sporosalibacterium faouarense]
MGFNKLFWGFLFMFDFRFNGFDILPDFVGYIFIFIGLKTLMNKNQNFSTAKNLALPLIFLSILDIFQPQNNAGGVNITYGPPLMLVIGIAVTVINLIMVYKICNGISELAQQQEKIELSKKAMTRWMLYLINNLIILLGFVVPGLVAILFIVIIIYSFVMYILMLLLMRESERELGYLDYEE